MKKITIILIFIAIILLFCGTALATEKINTMNAATDVPLENEEIFPEKTVADVLAKKSSILHPQVHQAIFSDE